MKIGVRSTLAGALLLATGACSLPPYTSAGVPFTVTYAMIVPDFAPNVALPNGVPAFSNRTAAPSTVQVPKEASAFKLTQLTLNLTLTNNGPLPLVAKFYLARTAEPDVYATTPLGAEQPEVDLPRGGETIQKTFVLDTALVNESKLNMGYAFSSAGL